MTSVLQVPSEARFSRVVLLRSWISTLSRETSSLAEPAKVIGLPGATISGWAAVGGTIAVGSLIDTDGATPDSLTIHVRSLVSRSELPFVSVALACAIHLPS